MNPVICLILMIHFNFVFEQIATKALITWKNNTMGIFLVMSLQVVTADFKMNYQEYSVAEWFLYHTKIRWSLWRVVSLPPLLTL